MVKKGTISLFLFIAFLTSISGQNTTFTSAIYKNNYQSKSSTFTSYDSLSYLEVPYITTRNEYQAVTATSPVNAFIRYYNSQTLEDYKSAHLPGTIITRKEDQVQKAFKGKADVKTFIVSILTTYSGNIETAYIKHKIILPDGRNIIASSPFTKRKNTWYLDAKENRKSIAYALSSLKDDVLYSLIIKENFSDNTLKEISERSNKPEGLIIESVAYMVNNIVFNRKKNMAAFNACCSSNGWTK